MKSSIYFVSLVLQILFAILCLLFFPFSVFAVTVQIQNVPTSLSQDQEFTVDVSIGSASASTTNYLRAAFYHDSSTTSYFGYTFNHESVWYNGEPSIDPKKFLQIQISGDGTYSGKLKSKIDLSSSFFKGSGNYNFKVGRYTANGTSVSEWSNSVVIAVAVTTPTPTNAQENTPVPTSAPPADLTSIPVPTEPIFTPIPIPSKKLTPTVTPKPTDKKDVLGASMSAALTQKKQEVRVLGSKKSVMPNILIGIGVIILAVCGILWFRAYKKQKLNENVEL